MLVANISRQLGKAVSVLSSGRCNVTPFDKSSAGLA